MKTTIKTLIVTGAALAAVLAASSSAQAQILAVDNFNYASPSNTQRNIGNTGIFNGGTGWGGAWYTTDQATSLGYISDFDDAAHDGVSLSYAGLQPGATFSSSYLREVTYEAGGVYNNDVHRTLGAGVSGRDLAGNTVWGDFAYNYTNGGISTPLKFSLGGTTLLLGGSSANQLLLFEVNYSATGVGVLSYWQNPSATAFDPSSTPTGTVAVGDITGVDFAINDSATAEGNLKGGVIAFGANSSDLVTTVSAPEPSTYAMLSMGIGAVWLMSLRRRKTLI